MERKFPFLATLICFCAFLLLLGLGIWQVQRLSWKNNLQSQLDTLMSQQVLSHLHIEDFRPASPDQLGRGVLEGTFLFSKALYLNGYVFDGRAAFPVVVPVLMDGKADQVVVAILWIERTKNPEKWMTYTDRHAAFSGMIRLPERGLFRPKNVAEKNEWWTFDLPKMSELWGFSYIEPALFYAENAAPLDESQEPYPVPKLLRNDHAQYAIFWFTMAGILCIFWGLRFLRPYLHSA